MIELLPSQLRFLSGALAPGVRTAALSLPRGEGKSTLAAYILERCMTPDDALFEEGAEYLLCAASIEGARHVCRPIRAELEPTGDYTFLDSQMRLGITHKPTNTKLRVMSSNAKTAFGIVGTPLLVADEPGAWEIVGGGLLHDAIQTAQGKPLSSLRVIYVGTMAPMGAPGHWFYDLVDAGTQGSTFVQSLVGDAETWDKWATIRKANPLKAKYAESRAVLLEERDAARRDSRLKARYLSYRLNVPTQDESTQLLTVDDWKLVEARPQGIPSGRPIVGVDLGGGRAWSAAVAVWQSGRMEAIACAPGIPSIEDQERRDNVPSGVYVKLMRSGALTLAQGMRVQPPSALWEAICDRWGVPVKIVCDRFRLNDLRDTVGNACKIEPRVTQWSSSSADIRALRKICRDGPLSVDPQSRNLLVVSMSAAYVENDNAGNVRLIKKGHDNKARDDVAAAAVLAAGAFERASSAPVRKLSYASV